jgi:predicted DNA-binding transcriptional regulator YafY
VWYLVAAVEGELRTYRVSRIQSARITDETCVRPDNFDLAAYWEQSSIDFKANLPRYPATVRVDPAILTYMRTVGRYARIVSTEPPDADGWIRVSMLFEGEHNACEYVLSFGSQMEVVEPQALREKVIEAAESIIALYQSSTIVP